MSSNNPLPFATPRWLLCTCCVGGMAVAACCALVSLILIDPTLAAPALLFSFILFTYCLHTLASGSCPPSPIEKVMSGLLRIVHKWKGG